MARDRETKRMIERERSRDSFICCLYASFLECYIVEIITYSLFNLAFFHSLIYIYIFFMSFHSSTVHFFKLYFTVWLYHSLFIHSSTEGHCGYFILWAIISKSTVDIHRQAFVWKCFYYF